MDIADGDTVRIKDLGLAAALVSLEFPIVETVHGLEGRAFFIFNNTQELSAAIEGYWANTLDVKARYYFDAIKMLKSRIYR